MDVRVSASFWMIIKISFGVVRKYTGTMRASTRKPGTPPGQHRSRR